MAEKRPTHAWSEATPEGEVTVYHGAAVVHKDGTADMKTKGDFTLGVNEALDFYAALHDSIDEARTNFATHRGNVNAQEVEA